MTSRQTHTPRVEMPDHLSPPVSERDANRRSSPRFSPGCVLQDDGTSWAPDDSYYAHKQERAERQMSAAFRYVLLPCLAFAAMVLLAQACGWIQ